MPNPSTVNTFDSTLVISQNKLKALVIEIHSVARDMSEANLDAENIKILRDIADVISDIEKLLRPK